jgi:hypothetical protein
MRTLLRVLAGSSAVAALEVENAVLRHQRSCCVGRSSGRRCGGGIGCCWPRRAGCCRVTGDSLWPTARSAREPQVERRPTRQAAPVTPLLAHQLTVQGSSVCGETRNTGHRSAMLIPCACAPQAGDATEFRPLQGRGSAATTSCSSTLQPPLELPQALRQRRQLGVLRLQPHRQSEQYIDHRLAPLRVDRLRLQALHAESFARPETGPCRLNAYVCGRSFEASLWDSSGTHVVCTSNKNPRFTGVLGADDGTRTHDLLHGKQTL